MFLLVSPSNGEYVVSAANFHKLKLPRRYMGHNDVFEIFRDAAGQFRWRLKAGNHEIVATSEAYVSKQAAMNSVQSVPHWSSNTPIKDKTQ
jgi:uncharacterized protein YegP (UPF0339 family)